MNYNGGEVTFRVLCGVYRSALPKGRRYQMDKNTNWAWIGGQYSEQTQGRYGGFFAFGVRWGTAGICRWLLGGALKLSSSRLANFMSFLLHTTVYSRKLKNFWGCKHSYVFTQGQASQSLTLELFLSFHLFNCQFPTRCDMCPKEVIIIPLTPHTTRWSAPRAAGRPVGRPCAVCRSGKTREAVAWKHLPCRLDIS